MASKALWLLKSQKLRLKNLDWRGGFEMGVIYMTKHDENDAIDRQEPAEIEITEEMIETGSDAIDPYVGYGSDGGGQDTVMISRLVLEAALQREPKHADG